MILGAAGFLGECQCHGFGIMAVIGMDNLRH
jgi:hypothetical protein